MSCSIPAATPEPTVICQPYPRADRPPFVDPSKLFDALRQEPRRLWSAWSGRSSWDIWKRRLIEAHLPFIAIRTGPMLFILVASDSRPDGAAVQVDKARALALAECWTKHRRKSEIDASAAWRLPVFAEPRED
jgi:hypothetical protein